MLFEGVLNPFLLNVLIILGCIVSVAIIILALVIMAALIDVFLETVSETRENKKRVKEEIEHNKRIEMIKFEDNLHRISAYYYMLNRRVNEFEKKIRSLEKEEKKKAKK
jgi:uncharacterized protein YlxW (UPF0749 family)